MPDNDEKIKYTQETRIKEILHQIIENDGLTKEELKYYYTNELGYNLKTKSAYMMFKRDLEELVEKKIIWFNEINDSKQFTINKNFGFPLNSAYHASGIYTIFFFGFKKGIIGKTDVLTVINPTIFDEIGDYQLEI
ncbi:hypothetical protein QT384_11260 (plasmid) [Arcobacter cryaerophilus gv. pseudocryaerophilus]|uniref:Uncharacterized protein n=3 Tax=Arcobacteraceae TaxID=2808963 RepID=A0AA96DV13_9BACT|nr:hypothetical protein RMP68_11260 [Arcobacter sp. AZ-2023]WNL37308.1 hypothetical protein RMQ66_11260 [Arcobacter sp. AZ-2023]WPD13023.1 hypothetical protein QT384_11260 [Arcobacter sp. DSM 115960]